MATYLDTRPAMGSIEIGYIWFAPFLQRTRQATEALFLMLSFAFDELKYRRIQWRCNALNEKSRAAALRLGFTFEGIFYQHMVLHRRRFSRPVGDLLFRDVQPQCQLERAVLGSRQPVALLVRTRPRRRLNQETRTRGKDSAQRDLSA
jgi:hypothetical protein